MSKHFQDIQKYYKFKISNKIYNKNLITSICLQKYWIALNISELSQNHLNNLIIYCNNLDFHHYSFNFQNSKKNPLNIILNNINGSIYIYTTNKVEQFFSILNKITLFHLVCYEKFFITFKDELQLSSIYNNYNNNFTYIYLILINFWYINLLIFSLIFQTILKIKYE